MSDMKQLFKLALSLAMTVILSCSVAYADNEDIYLEAKASVSKTTVYDGEVFEYAITLYTDNPNIGNVRYLDRPRTDNLQKVADLPAYNNVRRTKRDGIYAVDIASSAYASETKGNCTLYGGVIEVTFLVSTTVYDPFWGYMQHNRSVTRNVRLKDVKVKAKSLPKPDADFSGAVGEFSIDIDARTIEMDKGDQIVVSYVITGSGRLGDDTAMPDFKSLFSSPLRLMSVTPSFSSYSMNGEFTSRAVYECQFAATEYGEYVIPPLKFTYFDPAAGRYKTISSQECNVSVTAPKRKSPSHGQYVYEPTPINPTI